MFLFIPNGNEEQPTEGPNLGHQPNGLSEQQPQDNNTQSQPYPYGDQFNNFSLSNNDVELLAFAADLAYGPTDAGQYVVGSVGEPNLYIQDEQRTLLQSSMSPLLAAVNDITKRDAEFSLLQADIGNPSSYSSLEYLVISDQPVACRAKASLPTQYLQFGPVDAATHEPGVFAKVCVPPRTKFGPFEGEVQYISDLDLDVLNVQTPRYYPLLMIDECHILKTSNDNATNWMRYVRMAESFSQQNLSLSLENGEIFYVTTRSVMSNEELRVGYNDAYASRFVLPKLSVAGLQSIDNSLPENLLQAEGDGGNKEDSFKMRKEREGERRRLRSPSKRPRKQPRLEKVEVTATKKRSKKRKPLFKCNLCSKHYNTSLKLELHRRCHSEDHCKKPLTCSVCHQKCVTATALASHLHSHHDTLYTCVYCEQSYKYVRAFKQHVVAHQSENGSYECLLCNKHYAAYHLVRKHVRLFHSTQRYRCDKCDHIFPNINNLQRHKLTHNTKKPMKCRLCKKSFRRRDHLVLHTKRVHGEGRKDKKPKEEEVDAEREEKKSPRRGDVPCESKTSPVVRTEEPSDGSQYLKLSPVKANLVGSSSSNRRKQVPTKLKADDLNKHSETSKTLPIPFLMTEQALHEEFTKSDDVTERGQSKTKAGEPEEPKLLRVQSVTKETNNHTESDPSKGQTPYTCHLCSNGHFKRRGILVNHLTKVHPGIDLADIPSLNQPLIKPQLRFACSYCSNTYMSNIKRKEHILKHHPGEALPPSMRVSASTAEAKAEVVGTFEAEIHRCKQCPRQYGSRSRLLAHYRKSHPQATPPPIVSCESEPPKEDLDVSKEHIKGAKERVQMEECQEDELRSTAPGQIENEDGCAAYSTLDIQSLHQPEHQAFMNLQPPASPENKLLELSSAATMELSRFDFFNERAGADDLNRLPWFAESPLVGMDDEKYTQRTIELQFFEKIGKF